MDPKRLSAMIGLPLPPRAAADATAVYRPPIASEAEQRAAMPPDQFDLEAKRRQATLAGRLAAERAARTGTAGQLDADLATADRNLRAYK